jgi:hypothetical protein
MAILSSTFIQQAWVISTQRDSKIWKFWKLQSCLRANNLNQWSTRRGWTMCEAAGTCTSHLTPWHILLKKEPPRCLALESFVVVVARSHLVVHMGGCKAHVARDSAEQQSGAGDWAMLGLPLRARHVHARCCHAASVWAKSRGLALLFR